MGLTSKLYLLGKIKLLWPVLGIYSDYSCSTSFSCFIIPKQEEHKYFSNFNLESGYKFFLVGPGTCLFLINVSLYFYNATHFVNQVSVSL